MLILASASPRRSELLKLITGDFKVITSEIDERSIEQKVIKDGAEKVSSALALAKALDVAGSFASEDDIVIGADTSVILGDEILGKPGSREEAVDMLMRLSGRTHSVITGVAIVRGDRRIVFEEESRVTFCDLDDYQSSLIESYVDSGDPFDKAGAYGIQNGGALLVRSVEGDYFNVVGLPVRRLARELYLLKQETVNS